MRPTRRGFFGFLAGGAAAAIALDPERALWVPGKKLISVARPTVRLVDQGWAAAGPGIKIGDTLHIRRPVRFRASPGNAFYPEPIVRGYDIFIVTSTASSSADLLGSGSPETLKRTLQFTRNFPGR